MRKLISFRGIENVTPIEGADFLELADIGGWKCVVTKGEFDPGEEGIYVEIDAFVDTSHPAFKFLEPKAIVWKGKTGARIKTIKLRGQISQGLLLPKTKFTDDELTTILSLELSADNNNEEAYEKALTALNIFKWEPMENGEGGAKLGGGTKGNWPYFLQKTDQERIQNLWNAFGNKADRHTVVYEVKDPESERFGEVITVERPFKYIKDTLYEVTIKLDGSSMTVYHNEGVYGVCSRNWEIKEDSDLAFAEKARELNLKEILTTYGKNIALQMELFGEGIQKNPEKIKGLEVVIFDVYDIDRRSYVNATERYKIISDLNKIAGEERFINAPILETIFFDFKTIEEALSYAEGPSYNRSVGREGVVFKSLEDPSFSFKIISNRYLLKNDL